MTSIEWTDETWNPVVGCTIVSAGCTNCYAMGHAHRGLRPEHRGLTVMRDHGKGPRWNGEVRFLPERLAEPLSWRKPRLVFVNSMSDLFHEGVTFKQIAAVFGVMAACTWHGFQVLTKRPKRARDFFVWLAEQGEELQAAIGEEPPGGSPIPSACAMFVGRDLSPPKHAEDVLGERGWRNAMRAPWPLPNVWLGVSVEDQRTADERVPWLLELPAAVRWVSCEPMLGPVDFTSIDILGQTREEPHPHDPVVRVDALRGHVRGPDELLETRLDWIVVGGESGGRARPMHPAWARAVRDQCAAAGVPFFFKQWGQWAVAAAQPGGDLGGEMRAGSVRIVQRDREPDGHFRDGDVFMRRMKGKSASGRVLDGRTHDDLPEVAR